MTETALVVAQRLMAQATDAVRAAVGRPASDNELMAVLALCEGVVRQLDRVTVDTVAGLERRGAFAERGYRSTTLRPTSLVSECGGHRPHVNVLIRLDDLQNRARAACLDFG